MPEIRFELVPEGEELQVDDTMPTKCEQCARNLLPGHKDDTRVWLLSIDEGFAGVHCQECGSSFSDNDNPEELSMDDTKVKMVYVPDHPNLGGWHGDRRCDCSWYFRAEVAQ